MSIIDTLLLEYKSKIDEYFIYNKDATINLANLLFEIFSDEKLCFFLKELLKDEQQLVKISRKSYLHGNGFLKIILLDNGYKLRLHIWFPEQYCEENIHDHRWSFASLILIGSLKNEIWCDNENGISLREYIYHAETENNVSKKIEIGYHNFCLEKTDVYTKGQRYFMSKEKLHRIVTSKNEIVATMICTAPTNQTTTRLISICDNIDPVIQPPKISVEDLKSCINRFLNYCDVTSGC